jgi:citrate lyase beta subunit
VLFGDRDVPEIWRLAGYGGGQTRHEELPVVRLRAPGFQTVLDSLVGSGAGTVLLADCRGVEDLQRCDVALSVSEARAGRVMGDVRIVACLGSAEGVMRISTLGGKSARLAGLAWNPHAFSEDMACPADSAITEHALAQVLIAARAFGLPAYVFASEA